MPPVTAQACICIAPVWPTSLSIAPVHLKSALGVPFCSPEESRTHLCSRYHFRVHPGAGLPDACPLNKKSHCILSRCPRRLRLRVHRRTPKLIEKLRCTGYAQTFAHLARSQIRRKPRKTRTFSNRTRFSAKNVSENHSPHDRKVFHTPFLEFYRVSSFHVVTKTRESDSSFASGRQARTHL